MHELDVELNFSRSYVQTLNEKGEVTVSGVRLEREDLCIVPEQTKMMKNNCFSRVEPINSR